MFVKVINSVASYYCGKRPTKKFLIAIIILSFFAAIAVNNRKISKVACKSVTLNEVIPSPNKDPVQSYCSLEADRSGPHQNVIAYSLYGDFSNPNHYARYAEPIKFILSNISQVYPGLQIYYNLNYN